MSSNSRIEWTQSTWNPVTGCTSISEGCQHCYARRMANRLKGMGVSRYSDGFQVATHRDLLTVPCHWKKPRLIFVNSMGDLFHEQVPFAFIKEVFRTIESTPRHTFQLLTKRADRMAKLADKLPWPHNLWVGVTVELRQYMGRIEKLKQVPATVRFVSFEPLLGPVESPQLDHIHWAIVGGESGPHARKMEADWARSIRDACVDSSVPFFFKQWGGTNRMKRRRSLDRKLWNQYPNR